MNKNKPKLLYIITQGHWGGAQKYVFDLVTSLTDNYDITVAVGEPNNMPDLQKKLLSYHKIKLIQLNFLQRAISPARDLLAILEIKNLYKKIKPDIVHLNSTKAGVLGSLATYHLSPINYKLIYTVHGWVFNEPMNKLKKNIYKIMEYLSSKRKNKIIILSDKEKNTGIKALKIKEDKFKVIPVGVDDEVETLSKTVALTKINSLLPNNKINEEDFVFGTIANLYPTKDLVNLIEAFNIAKEKLNNFHSIIIGEGKDRSHLEFLTKKYKLENNVHLIGFVNDAQKLLRAFDVFVLSSKKEGMPYTIMEAKANGVPVISTNVGSISKIIQHKKTGILVEPKNTEKLAEALVYAYEHKKEMQEMAKVAQAEKLPEHLKNTMILETSSIYKHYLNK